MRSIRRVSLAALTVGALVLALPSTVSALSLPQTTSLTGGVCTSATSCILVGDDAGANGAVTSLTAVQDQSKVAPCQSDARTVGIAVAALEAENPKGDPTTPAGWKAGLLDTHYTGGPFLQSWPNENARYYTISVAGTATGRTTGDKVKTSNGDVLVDAVQHGARTYDATVNPVSACEDLHVLEATAGTEASDASVDGIQAIACPSHSTTCYGASALRSPSEGAVVAIDVSSSAQPTVTSTIPVVAAGSLKGITCPTSSLCIAVGAGPSLDGVVVPILRGAVGTTRSIADASLEGVACATASRCVAVGEDLSSSKGVIAPIQLSGAAVILGTPVDVASTTSLEGVTCPTSQVCLAVGDRAHTGVVVPVGVASARPSPGSAQLVPRTAVLRGVECLGSGACDATGTRSGSPDTGVLVGVSQGRAGTAFAVSGAVALDDVACAGSTVCYGVGAGASTGVIEQLARTIVTSTSLRSSTDRIVLRHVVVLTATVASAPSAGIASFTMDGATIAGCGAVRISDGAARCAFEVAKAGAVVLRAAFSGDADERASTSQPQILRATG